MAIRKKLSEDEMSESRKEVLKEVKSKPVVTTQSTKHPKSFDRIVETLGNNKMMRKELREKSGLTDGQIAGCIHRSKQQNDILKFEDGLFYVEK